MGAGFLSVSWIAQHNLSHWVPAVVKNSSVGRKSTESRQQRLDLWLTNGDTRNQPISSPAKRGRLISPGEWRPASARNWRKFAATLLRSRHHDDVAQVVE